MAATGYAPGSQPNAGPVHRPSYPHTPGAIDPRARAHPDHAPAAPALHAAAPQGAYGSGAYEPPQTGDPRLGPPSGYDQTAHYDTDENDTASRRFPWMRVAVVMIFAVAIGASAAFYFKGAVSLSGLTQFVAGTSSEPSSAGPPVVRAPREEARVVSTSTSVATNSIVTASSIAVTEQPAVTPAPTQDPTTTPTQSQTPHSSQVTSPVPSQPPTAGAASAALVFGSTATEVDAALQKTKLWPVLKREFSNWYAQQVNDIIRAKAQRKDDIAIANSLAQAVVKLRRDNADAALSASPARLQAVAASFVDNLDRLAKHSTEACYGYISAGEADPVIADLMRNSELAIPLQAQLAAIFEAIADGRRAPRKQGQAQTADFDALATHLGKRGWSPLDLQLFSDARALSRAAPVRVCKMVRDWFTAQLDIQDEAIQIRLLIETLKPVVSG